MPADKLLVAEPAGQYARQPPLVVDCSVLAAVLFDEPQRDAAVLAMANKELFAPDLLDHEIVSVALKKSTAGHPELANQALADLQSIRMTRCNINVADQFHLAEHTGLTAYGAAYLQLALELRAPLATFDKKLGRAAEKILSASWGIAEY
jgi:predicted nucleic acid-binding protein